MIPNDRYMLIREHDRPATSVDPTWRTSTIDPNRIAAIWQDGQPPKDGSYIMAVFDNDPPVVVRWGRNDGIYCWVINDNKYVVYIDDPDKWAELTGW